MHSLFGGFLDDLASSVNFGNRKCLDMAHPSGTGLCPTEVLSTRVAFLTIIVRLAQLGWGSARWFARSCDLVESCLALGEM